MKRFAVLGLLLAAVAMMIVACTPPAAPAVPAPAQGAAEAEKPAEAPPTEEPKEPEIAATACVPIPQIQPPKAASNVTVTDGGCFVPHQFIMYGTPIGIACVIDTADMQKYEPFMVKEIVLQAPGECACKWPLTLTQFGYAKYKDEGLVIRLYESRDKGTVQEIVSAAMSMARKNPCMSITEPNYLLGDPGTLKGSPWIPVGSPDQAEPAEAPAEQFDLQPAFAIIGQSPPATSGGSEVRIGIFDTAPTSFGVAPGTSKSVTVGPTSTGHQITMKVTNLLPSATVTPQSSSIEDHGLFVAGLVKAVAPEADVELYQVLNEQAVGDLFTLMEAIKSFLCTGTATPDGFPSPSVINLSLGLHWYPVSAWPEETCGSWISDFADIWSLQDLLDAAYKLGVVVVAAAGNNANNAVGATESADIPAAWPNTIGVAASSPSGTGLACFSSTGDVRAPGGEGVKSPSNTECKPQFKTCNPTGDCADYGLVSLGAESSTGYWYWAGTSFAAPLVSGLVARCLQEAADAGAAWPAADVPANVWKAIQAGAASHNGVIHVGDTLAKCK